MDASLLGFIIALAIVAVIVLPLGGALRRYPVVFYAVAVLATVAYLWAMRSGVNLTAVRPITFMMQKGYLASIMLAVVMFCGCFDEGTPVRKKLQPIRGELSILSFIFILAHLTTYLPSYLGRFTLLMSSSANIAFSLVVALVLTVLFLVLAVTSFRWVRQKMSVRAWKNLQRGAYVMVALLAVHVAFVLGRPAFANPLSPSMASFATYMVVIATYVVLRLRKWNRGRVSVPI